MRLFERILGARFEALAPEVQALHRQVGIKEGEISLRASPIMQLFGFPHLAKMRHFGLAREKRNHVAIWRRQIKDRELRSEVWQSGDLVVERMGVVTITSELVIAHGALSQETRGVRFMDMPLPRALWPRVTAREWGAAGDVSLQDRSACSYL
ncbi:DUF4166 domain-containing protein [Lentibacter algarum]|uniref:DUF4166 domain-containing protein n=1 Tax=Lentibacter algarum TaxID=576131 RepID=UPI003AF506AE